MNLADSFRVHVDPIGTVFTWFDGDIEVSQDGATWYACQVASQTFGESFWTSSTAPFDFIEGTYWRVAVNPDPAHLGPPFTGNMIEFGANTIDYVKALGIDFVEMKFGHNLPTIGWNDGDLEVSDDGVTWYALTVNSTTYYTVNWDAFGIPFDMDAGVLWRVNTAPAIVPVPESGTMIA